MENNNVFYIGIDVGSTTVKVVMTNEREILFHKYIRHFANQRKSIITLLE